MLAPFRRYLLFIKHPSPHSNRMRSAEPEACGQRLAVTRVFTIVQLMYKREPTLIRILGMATLMQNDPHLGAAELQQTRRPNASRCLSPPRQKDHLTVDEHLEQTMEQDKNALERSQAAHRKSVQSMEKPQMSKAPRQSSSDA